MLARLKVRMVVLPGLMLAITTLTPSSAADQVADEARQQYVRATRAALAALQADLKDFQFTLEYHGPDAAKYRSLMFNVAPLPDSLPPSWLTARISKEEAAILIGHLASDGHLYRGLVNREKQLMVPKGPYYILTVQSKQGDSYFDILPWGTESYSWHGMSRSPMLRQFDGLRAVLTGKAAEAMDQLVAARPGG